MTKIFTAKLKGFFFSNMVGIGLIAASKWLVSDENSGVIVWSDFIVIPILMGMTGSWFWQDAMLNTRRLVAYTLYNCLLAILFSYLFLGEGVICLIIVSPLLGCFMLVGALVGRNMYKKNNDKLNISVALVLLLIFVGDMVQPHHYENEVTDTIIIKAPPAKVWDNVVAFKRITQPADFWLFRIGMPSPVESTVTGYYKGAGRKCIFSNNYVFDEVISTYDPGKNLTFDIVNQPKDPEIMNHIAILRGQFLLKDNGNGTTTLTGNSWYQLYVFPTWYYDIWAKSITRNVHLRVMEHIKQLSEE